MSRDRYQEIMKHLRFDDFFSRRQRRETDKFCLISEVWNCFIESCKKCYVPNFDLTINEQLFPCKARCPFTQYMANKPDKFGIKFWLLADAQSKYSHTSPLRTNSVIPHLYELYDSETRPQKILHNDRN